jgi:hypothetical protein
MGWVSEIGDFFKLFKPAEILDIYESGLHIRHGAPINRRVKLPRDERRKLYNQEWRELERVRKNGIFRLINPFIRPDYQKTFKGGKPKEEDPYIPDNCVSKAWAYITNQGRHRKSLIARAFALPVHKKRYKYQKPLKGGHLYAYIPFLDKIYSDKIVPQTADINEISLPLGLRNVDSLDEIVNQEDIDFGRSDVNVYDVKKSRFWEKIVADHNKLAVQYSLMIVANVLYKVTSIEDSWRKVDNYRDAMDISVQKALTSAAVGYGAHEWLNGGRILGEVENNARKLVNKKLKNWGTQVLEINITSHSIHKVLRLLHEGNQNGGSEGALLEEE